MNSVHRNSQNSRKVIPSRSGYHCNINAADGGLAFGGIGCVSCVLFEEDPDPLVTYMSTFLRDSPLSNNESSVEGVPALTSRFTAIYQWLSVLCVQYVQLVRI